MRIGISMVKGWINVIHFIFVLEKLIVFVLRLQDTFESHMYRSSFE